MGHEQNKQARRARILAAARQVLDSEGAAALTMRKLAQLTGLAEMTPYNLFGTKADVLHALFESSLDRLVVFETDSRTDDPVERVLTSADHLADLLISGGWFTELLKAARAAGANVAAFSDLAMRPLIRSLGDARSAGQITDEVPVEVLARQIHLTHIGVIELWGSGELDEAELRRDLGRAPCLALLPVATEPTRARLLARLDEL